MGYRTYWNHNGWYEATGDELSKLIPRMGEVTAETVPEGRGYRKLENLRKGMNAYYDLYNNGGGNPGRKTAHYFPGCITLVNHRRNKDGRYVEDYWAECHKITEPIMDRMIVMAALEQGITIVSNSAHSHEEL